MKQDEKERVDDKCFEYLVNFKNETNSDKGGSRKLVYVGTFFSNVRTMQTLEYFMVRDYDNIEKCRSLNAANS